MPHAQVNFGQQIAISSMTVKGISKQKSYLSTAPRYKDLCKLFHTLICSSQNTRDYNHREEMFGHSCVLSATLHSPSLNAGFRNCYISVPPNQQFAGNWPVATPFPQKPLILPLKKFTNHHYFTTVKGLINALVNKPIILS